MRLNELKFTKALLAGLTCAAICGCNAGKADIPAELPGPTQVNPLVAAPPGAAPKDNLKAMQETAKAQGHTAPAGGPGTTPGALPYNPTNPGG